MMAQAAPKLHFRKSAYGWLVFQRRLYPGEQMRPCTDTYPIAFLYEIRMLPGLFSWYEHGDEVV